MAVAWKKTHLDVRIVGIVALEAVTARQIAISDHVNVCSHLHVLLYHQRQEIKKVKRKESKVKENCNLNMDPILRMLNLINLSNLLSLVYLSNLSSRVLIRRWFPKQVRNSKRKKEMTERIVTKKPPRKRNKRR